MASATYNLARFDLVSVRLAVACAQTGSLTTAARENHLALAAASRNGTHPQSSRASNPMALQQSPPTDRCKRLVYQVGAGQRRIRQAIGLRLVQPVAQLLRQDPGRARALRQVTRHGTRRDL